MRQEFTAWLDDASQRLNFMFDFVASPFIAISRQTIVKKAMARGQDRIIMVDDDVILPDAAILDLIASQSQVNIITYPAKHDDNLIVAGDIYSPKHPDETFPSLKLWKSKDDLDWNESGEFGYVNAHWAGMGAFSMAAKWSLLTPNFNISQEFNPWIHNIMFMGEDVTFFTKLRTLAPYSFWRDYYASLDNPDAAAPSDRKFQVKFYLNTQHLKRMENL